MKVIKILRKVGCIELMRRSNYILHIELIPNVLLFNLYNGKIVILNDLEFNLYTSEVFDKLENETFNTLIKYGFLIQNDLYDEIISRINNNRQISINLNITNQCNLNCNYCYFKATNKESEKYEIDANKFLCWIEDIYLNGFSECDSLYINFLGGEPLIKINLVCEIAGRLSYMCKKLNKSYLFQLTTNGYYLDRENSKKLLENGINTVQVSIDGSEYNISDNDTYEHIISNLKDISDIIHVTLRVNFTNNTKIENMEKLLIELKKAKINKIYFAPVEKNLNNSKNAMELAVVNDDLLKMYSKFWQLQLKHGYEIIEPLPAIIGICIAKNTNGVTINSDGNIYPCPSLCGIKDLQYNNIYNYNINVKRKIDLYSKCKECILYPICLGGCEYQNYISDYEKNCNMQYKITLLKEFIRNKYLGKY